MQELSRNLQVKKYLDVLFAAEDEDLLYVHKHSLEISLKPIAVPQSVGKMLYFFCLLKQPSRLLEIGTLGGYSTLWLAKAMPAHAHLITIEREEERAQIAKAHFQQTTYGSRIELRVGLAEMLLQRMIEERQAAFDLIFIDADKENYAVYLEKALALSRPGTLILSDNLIPKRGNILSPDPRDTEALAIYAFNEQLAAHPRLETALFPTFSESGRLDAIGAALVKF